MRVCINLDHPDPDRYQYEEYRYGKESKNTVEPRRIITKFHFCKNNEHLARDLKAFVEA